MNPLHSSHRRFPLAGDPGSPARANGVTTVTRLMRLTGSAARTRLTQLMRLTGLTGLTARTGLTRSTRLSPASRAPFSIRVHWRSFVVPLLCAAALAIAIAIAGVGCSSRADEKDGVVELRFWHAWGGNEGKSLEALIAEFNRTHPHIRVEPTFYSIGDKLLAAIAGGKPPDVATVWDFMLVTMGESGCFLPLEGRLADAGFTPDSFLPNIWEYGQFGEHKWGMPTTLNCLALYMNTAALKEAGLDPAHPPRSTGELTEWGRKLVKFDDRGNLRRNGFVPAEPVVWMWNFGGDIFDAKTKRFTLDREENIKALEWMAEQYNICGGGDPKAGLDNWRRFSAGFGQLDSPQNPFFVGKIAMKEDGQWAIQFIGDYSPDLDYEIVPFPAEAGDTMGFTRISGSFWVIPVGSKHPEEAWEFLRWLIAPAQSARFCARLRNIPPLQATLSHPEFAPLLSDPKFKLFIDMVLQGKAKAPPASPVQQQLTEALTQSIESVFGGKVPAREFLTRLNVEMNKSLQRELEFIGPDDETGGGK